MKLMISLLEAKMSPTKLNEKEKLILLEKDIMKIQDRLNHMDTYSYKMSKRRKTDLHHCRVADESRLYNNAKSCKEIKC